METSCDDLAEPTLCHVSDFNHSPVTNLYVILGQLLNTDSFYGRGWPTQLTHQDGLQNYAEYIYDTHYSFHVAGFDQIMHPLINHHFQCTIISLLFLKPCKHLLVFKNTNGQIIPSFVGLLDMYIYILLLLFIVFGFVSSF